MLIVAMADDKIKLLLSVQKFYHMMGIYPSQTKNQKTDFVLSFNAKNTFQIISMMELVISTLVFIFVEAKSSDEFGIAFYVLITVSHELIHFLINMIIIKSELLELIGKYEAFIEKSELNSWDWNFYVDLKNLGN